MLLNLNACLSGYYAGEVNKNASFAGYGLKGDSRLLYLLANVPANHFFRWISKSICMWIANDARGEARRRGFREMPDCYVSLDRQHILKETFAGGCANNLAIRSCFFFPPALPLSPKWLPPRMVSDAGPFLRPPMCIAQPGIYVKSKNHMRPLSPEIIINHNRRYRKHL